MTRPKPRIIINTNVTDLMSVEVLAAKHLYTVLYNDSPINIRQKYWTAQGETVKYLKTTYASLASAENLCKRLNKQFFTDEFTVKEII